jgi:hypothetical protein
VLINLGIRPAKIGEGGPSTGEAFQPAGGADVREGGPGREKRVVLLALTIAQNGEGLAARANGLRQRHGHKTPNQIRAEQKALAVEAATEFKLAA